MAHTALTQLLTDLVSLPSINPYDEPLREGYGEKAVAAFICSYLQAAGIACELVEHIPDRPSVCARVQGAGNDALWFDAHMDTVSGADMQVEPFTALRKGNKIYGRGAADTKGSIAAMMTALVRTAQSSSKPPMTILFTTTADEEHLMRGISGLLASGMQAKAAVVGEPTDLKIITAHKGMVRFRISTFGKAAHSSAPHEGINAIHGMGRILRHIETYICEELDPVSHPLLGKPTLSVGTIQGGQSVNIIPDRCDIELDRRLLPGEDARSAIECIRTYLHNTTGDICKFVVSEPYAMGPGFAVPLDHPLVCAASSSVTEITGSVSLDTMMCATHAGHISAAGIPAIVLGPGQLADAHTATEAIDIESLEQAAHIYEHLMMHGIE